MKVGMILWSAFPPDIRVKREARELVRNSNEVHIICKDKRGEINEEVMDGIHIRRVQEREYISGVVEELVRHATLISPNWYKKLKAICQEESYDIIHVHDLPPLPTTLRAIGDRDTPIVADFHELYPESVVEWRKPKSKFDKLRPYILFKPIWRLKRIERKCIQKIDGSISESPEQLEYLRNKYDFSEIEAGVVRNVPDLKRFEQMPVEQLDYDGFVVSYIGGFSPQRGLETAITSFAQLLDTAPDATLLMVGDSNDNYIEKLKDLTEELGIESHVEFTGWVDFERVPSFLQASDVTLCTWVGDNIDSECTLPNKLFQSMHMGVPVVVSDLRAMRSVVEETECGLIFEPGSAASLTGALLELYENPELRRQLSANAKEAVRTRYNIREEGKTLERIYENLLKKTSRES